MKLSHWLSLLMVILLAGCASSKRRDLVEQADWASRIGSYTYQQAVDELGKPDLLVESNEGNTAEWILKQSSRMSFGVGVGGSRYSGSSSRGVGVGTSVSPRPRGEYLRLRFDTNDKLKEWAKVKH